MVCGVCGMVGDFVGCVGWLVVVLDVGTVVLGG